MEMRLSQLLRKSDYLGGFQSRLHVPASPNPPAEDDWVRLANQQSLAGLRELVATRQRRLDRRALRLARKIVRRNRARSTKLPASLAELADLMTRSR